MAGPLEGLRVIEFAHVMAGPVCGMMLADMGADVVKVEKVAGGDDTRRMVPPRIGAESAAFMMMNRNKRGCALDLKDPGAQEAALAIAAGADVVIENYRKGTMARLGLGYEQVSAANPRVIYAELSGFGRTGPYADRGGFDLVAQGMSGLMRVTGAGDGGPPMKCGPPISDITAGILAAMGVLGALHRRGVTGRGQRVDCSLYEAAITQTYWQSAIALATGVSPPAMGSAHPLNAPYQAFETADGWITLGAANQTNWLRMLEVIGRPELASDRRFLDNDARMRNLHQLESVLGEVFRGHSSKHWLSSLEDAGVPAGPVLDVLEMTRDPQTLAREMVTEVRHSSEGMVKTIGHPVKYSDSPVRITRGAPRLGEHTREVLVEAGLTPAAIDALIERGAAVEV